MFCCIVSAGSTVVCAQRRDSLRSYKINEVEVVGSYLRRGVQSTTPLHIISSEDILHQGITDMADALNRIPGIVLRDYGGAGGMKTVSVRGFSAKHTGVVYDGVMLSECQTGEIDVSRYSLNNVDAIQLAEGDNDDIFIPARQASMASVLSIATMQQEPEDKKAHLQTALRWGSFGYVNPFVRYRRKLSGKLTLSTAGEYTYAENNYPFTLHNVALVTKERRTNSRMNSGHGEVDLRWHPDACSQWWTKFYYYDNDRQLPGQVRYYTNASGEQLRDRNAFAQVNGIIRNRQGNFSLKVNGKFNWASSIYHDQLYPNGVKDASYWQREYYGSACLLYTPSACWAFDYSADGAFNNLNSSLSTDTHPYRYTFLQSATARYNDNRWTVLVRLLYSLYVNRAHGGEAGKNMRRLSPSLSLAYRLLQDKDLYLRFSYKNIFRAPNFNESYYYHYGSTDLDPEITNQLNLGITWKGQLCHCLTGEILVDGYYNKIKDMIVAVPYNMFVWTNINVGQVSTAGYEITLKGNYKLSPRQQIVLSAGYSYQRAANHTDKKSEYYGNQIAYIPFYSGNSSIAWENPWVNIVVHGTGMSSRWTNNEHYEGTKVNGFWEMGITVYKPINWMRKQWNIRFDLRNMFNHQYEIVSHYPMPGISYQMTLNMSF